MDRTQEIMPATKPRREVILRIDEMGSRPWEVVLEPGRTYVVGSGENAAVRIEDPHISRSHAQLKMVPDGVDFEDLGSSNGTRINGVLVQSALLTSTTVVVMGSTRLRIDMIEPKRNFARFGHAVGASERMLSMFALLQKLAATDLSVSLLGETGTGKDVLARALHQASRRASGPFVVFDCGAVAANVIESELFGHVKGAFTGAISERKGAFEQAHRGTIFFDEIGELPLELQPRLLRALEQLTVRRVGGLKDIPVDVRVVAATNRDLEAEVKAGRFRQDLLFRLNVAVVRVPPLRERLEDLPLLVESILADLAHPVVLDDGALEVLASHDWPGNVRELKNVITSASAFACGHTLDAQLLNALARKRRDATLDRLPLAGRTLEALERAAIKQTLAKMDGNRAQAAEALGIAPSTVYEKIRKHGI